MKGNQDFSIIDHIFPPGTKTNPEVIIDEKTLEKIILLPKTHILPGEKRKGKYIVIEGIDGSGKTTISLKLREYLEEKGKRAEVVREPWTNEIKTLLSKYPNMNPLAEAYLFAADRLLLHTQLIANYLQEHTYVIGDRSYIASLVYQTVRGAEEEIVIAINHFAIKPDIVILLDVTPETAWKRINNKENKQLQHLEEKRFLNSLREKYLELTKRMKHPLVHKIDAEKTPDEIITEIVRVLEKNKLL